MTKKQKEEKHERMCIFINYWKKIPILNKLYFISCLHRFAKNNVLIFLTSCFGQDTEKLKLIIGNENGYKPL